ncbi:hypothetical protein PSACC_02353 [Paramicrosporidium saccamoebae]|uniref:Uncharacterized protein n=1 Tax=Paramicrosporidium saccamoebae TaxID=1246581 RepID=A0A2H9TJB1_9FUNG|nr:hypothetical protein PSACC_02353 [Paramicrosporidium saccamoebae]
MLVRWTLLPFLFLYYSDGSGTTGQSKPTTPSDPRCLYSAKSHTIEFTDFVKMLHHAIDSTDTATVRALVDRSDWLVKKSTKEQRHSVARLLAENIIFLSEMCKFVKRNPFNGYPEFLKTVARDVTRLGPGASLVPLLKLHSEFPSIVESKYDSLYDLIGAEDVPLEHLEMLLRDSKFLKDDHLKTATGKDALGRMRSRVNLDIMALLNKGFWRIAVAKLVATAPTTAEMIEHLAKFVNHPLAFAQLYYFVSQMFQHVSVPPPSTFAGRVFQDALVALETANTPVPICQDAEGRTMVLLREILVDSGQLAEETRVDVAISLLSWATKRPVDSFDRPLKPAKDVPSIFNQVVTRTSEIASRLPTSCDNTLTLRKISTVNIPSVKYKLLLSGPIREHYQNWKMSLRKLKDQSVSLHIDVMIRGEDEDAGVGERLIAEWALQDGVSPDNNRLLRLYQEPNPTWKVFIHNEQRPSFHIQLASRAYHYVNT